MSFGHNDDAATICALQGLGSSGPLDGTNSSDQLQHNAASSTARSYANRGAVSPTTPASTPPQRRQRHHSSIPQVPGKPSGESIQMANMSSKPTDPVNWFGMLVPQSLKDAQTSFRLGMCLLIYYYGALSGGDTMLTVAGPGLTEMVNTVNIYRELKLRERHVKNLLDEKQSKLHQNQPPILNLGNFNNDDSISFDL